MGFFPLSLFFMVDLIVFGFILWDSKLLSRVVSIGCFAFANLVWMSAQGMITDPGGICCSTVTISAGYGVSGLLTNIIMLNVFFMFISIEKCFEALGRDYFGRRKL